MKIKEKKGLVIEMMIVFMLITFGFCMIMTTVIGTLSLERKYAKKEVNMQADLNQIGEYYLRSIEAGESFPTGSETNVSNFTNTRDKTFNWMDDDAKQFFIDCKKYNFKYESKYSITREGLLKFFETKYIWRKLVVRTQDDKIKMVIELKETKDKDNKTKATYFLQSWSMGDNLTTDMTGYKNDELNILEKLWRFIGLQINSIDDLLKDGDWYAFFIGNFQDAFKDIAV